MKFTVVDIKAGLNDVGFTAVIEAQQIIKVFGVEKTCKHKFRMKLDAEVPIGTEDDLNLSDYTQTPYTTETLEGEKRVTVWLHKKAA